MTASSSSVQTRRPASSQPVERGPDQVCSGGATEFALLDVTNFFTLLIITWNFVGATMKPATEHRLTLPAVVLSIWVTDEI